jgi:ferredoxin, 2Fe-2S
MATITYIEHDGTTHSVEVAEGDNVMHGALNNDLPGVS